VLRLSPPVRWFARLNIREFYVGRNPVELGCVSLNGSEFFNKKLNPEIQEIRRNHSPLENHTGRAANCRSVRQTHCWHPRVFSLLSLLLLLSCPSLLADKRQFPIVADSILFGGVVEQNRLVSVQLKQNVSFPFPLFFVSKYYSTKM